MQGESALELGEAVDPEALNEERPPIARGDLPLREPAVELLDDPEQRADSG